MPSLVKGWSALTMLCPNRHDVINIRASVQDGSRIILGMGSANERRRYIVTSSLVGWTHAQNDPWGPWLHWAGAVSFRRPVPAAALFNQCQFVSIVTLAPSRDPWPLATWRCLPLLGFTSLCFVATALEHHGDSKHRQRDCLFNLSRSWDIIIWERLPRYWPTSDQSSQRTRRFDVFFDVSLNKPLNKQSSCRWFETQWRPCDVIVIKSLSISPLQNENIR